MKMKIVILTMLVVSTASLLQVFAEQAKKQTTYKEMEKEVEKSLAEIPPELLEKMTQHPNVQYRLAVANMLFSYGEEDLNKQANSLITAIDWLRQSANSGNKEAESVLKHILENAESIAVRRAEQWEK